MHALLLLLARLQNPAPVRGREFHPIPHKIWCDSYQRAWPRSSMCNFWKEA